NPTLHFLLLDTAPTNIYTLSLHDALPIYKYHESDGINDYVAQKGTGSVELSLSILDMTEALAAELLGRKENEDGIMLVGESTTQIGRAHVCTPVTFRSRIPSSA